MDAEDRPLSVFGESPNGFPKLPILSPAEIPPTGQHGGSGAANSRNTVDFFTWGLPVSPYWPVSSAGSVFDSGTFVMYGPMCMCSTIQVTPRWIAYALRFVSPMIEESATRSGWRCP